MHGTGNVDDAALGALLERLVHPRFGWIRDIREVANYPDAAPIITMNAEVASPARFRGKGPRGPRSFWAGGAAVDRRSCAWATIGEAIERFAAGVYYEDELVHASAEELDGEIFPCHDMVLYSEDQYSQQGFPYRPYDGTSRRHWTTARRLRDGQQVWIPAQLVWLGFESSDRSEYLLQSVSSGLGAGRTADQAIRAGFYEVVERDAFAVHWMLRRAPGRIAATAGDLGLPDALARFLTRGIVDLTLLSLENEFGIPVVLAVIVPRSQAILVCGASAHHDPRQAAVKATIEACHTWSWALELRRRYSRHIEADAISTFEHHVRFYLDPRNFSNASFLFEGAEMDFRTFMDAFPPGERSFARALERVRGAGYEPYCCDLTRDDVREIGFEAVRVIIPGLQPLYVGRDLFSRDPSRLRRAAIRWGDAVPDPLPSVPPHPFP